MYAASLYAVGPDRPDESDGPHRVPAAGSRLADALRRLPGKPSDRSARHPNPATYGADRKDILASHAHVPHRQLLPAEPARRKCGQGMVAEHRIADHPAGKRAGRPESEHTHSGLLLRFRHSDRLPRRRRRTAFRTECQGTLLRKAGRPLLLSSARQKRRVLLPASTGRKRRGGAGTLRRREDRVRQRQAFHGLGHRRHEIRFLLGSDRHGAAHFGRNGRQYRDCMEMRVHIQPPRGTGGKLYLYRRLSSVCHHV